MANGRLLAPEQDKTKSCRFSFIRRIMLEKELREPVTNWLQQRGYDVVTEFLIGGYVDVIGCKFGKRVGRRVPPLLHIVAVELKLSDVAGVISQARNSWPHVHESWTAMPQERIDKMLEKTLLKFKYAHVGLLSIHEGQVKVILPPKINYGFQKRLWRRLHEGPASSMIKSWEN